MSGHPETAPSSPPPPAAAQGPPVSKHPVVKVTAQPLHISRQDSVQCFGTVAFQESGGGGGDGDDVDVRRSLESQKTTRIKGNGILASRADLDIDENVFAEGCKTLLAAARGDVAMMERLIDENPSFLHFRDCDRRTALHVAASEGQLELVRWLVERGARLNRSDRWGGSALDEAHRHRQTEVASFLRKAGATTGSADQTANLMAAAAAGDLKDVSLLLQYDDGLKNESDYDRRTPLHVACSAGNFAVAAALLKAGANVNAEDRWGSTPLDDVTTAGGGTKEVVALLKEYGGRRGEGSTAMGSSTRSGHHTLPFGDGGDGEGLFGGSEDLNVDVSELQMIERIGAGAFGEIYKCRWRGTMVAAKCIKSAKIRKEWLSKQQKNSYQTLLDKEHGGQTGEDSTLSDSAKDEAIRDFRDEIAILSKVRHPNICMLLAYCTTKDHEVIVSELMRCSLLDVFRANSVHNVKLSRRTQIEYARQLARGMNYLHTCRSPIIHRDLKPANLLIDFAGTLKITDFGLAKVRPKPRRSDDGNEPRQSNEKSGVDDEPFCMTGETGSYRYMAPEVFRHEPYDERVDVYSYAMVIYFVLSGHPPWPAMSGLRAVEEAAVEGRRPNLPRSWDGRWSVLLTACWKEEPAARPPFTVVVDMLDRYYEDLFGTDGEVGGGCGVGRRTRGGCVVS